MRTKIIYVLVSSPKDIYLEQLLVSLWSLRQYEPDADVTIMVDDVTKNTLAGWRGRQIGNLAATVQEVAVPAAFTPWERSRYIKTTIRRNAKGSFLFLDCDTVITAPLSGIDKVDAEVAMVPDSHVLFAQYTNHDYMTDLVRNLFGADVSGARNYFNSGAMLVKDTPIAHALFDKWHEAWQQSRQKGCLYDQPSLLYANQSMDEVISVLNGIYNCQVALSVRYLHEACVVHFFNSKVLHSKPYSPFFDKSLYNSIKETEGLTDAVKDMICSCKSQFADKSMIVGETETTFLYSAVGQVILGSFAKGGRLWSIVSMMAKVLRRLGVK